MAKVGGRQSGGLGDLVQQGKGGSAIVHHLAAHQIQRLNAVGAFVNLRHPHIAGELRRAAFFDKAQAAVHLNAQLRHMVAGIGAVSLGNWC